MWECVAGRRFEVGVAYHSTGAGTALLDSGSRLVRRGGGEDGVVASGLPLVVVCSVAASAFASVLLLSAGAGGGA